MKPAGNVLAPAEAASSILANVRLLASERCALRMAMGRVLQQEVLAERDNPPFDRVCMDGIAIDSGSLSTRREFTLSGIQGAGARPQQLADAAAAIEVMTGAVLPTGTDCVIPLEHYVLDAGVARLHEGIAPRAGDNIQRRGADSLARSPMLHAGCLLGAAEIAVVASAGLAEVQVSCSPRIAVVSNGDELVEPGLAVADHQVRRSNAYAVLAALRLHGHERLADEHVRDDPEALRASVGALLDGHDVLILSGGVSSGKFDHVPSVVAALGVAQVFHHVEQRPGRPLWFGTGPRGQLAFGLPGNPVSTLICLVRYVLPALQAAQGQRPCPPRRLALTRALPGRKMTFFMPVRLALAGDGTAAEPQPTRGSGDFLALAGTDGFVELPPRPQGYEAGFIADFHRW